jgi:hypothetical protein
MSNWPICIGWTATFGRHENQSPGPAESSSEYAITGDLQSIDHVILPFGRVWSFVTEHEPSVSDIPTSRESGCKSAASKFVDIAGLPACVPFRYIRVPM